MWFRLLLDNDGIIVADTLVFRSRFMDIWHYCLVQSASLDPLFGDQLETIAWPRYSTHARNSDRSF